MLCCPSIELLEVLPTHVIGGHWNLSCRKALPFKKHHTQGPEGPSSQGPVHTNLGTKRQTSIGHGVEIKSLSSSQLDARIPQTENHANASAPPPPRVSAPSRGSTHRTIQRRDKSLPVCATPSVSFAPASAARASRILPQQLSDDG